MKEETSGGGVKIGQEEQRGSAAASANANGRILQAAGSKKR